MTAWKKVLLLQIAFLFAFFVLGAGMHALSLLLGLGLMGAFLHFFLFCVWVWLLFGYLQYRHCRQQEFLYLLHTAAKTKAPLEGMLRSYLEDRPREFVYRAILLSFVFPGYYWIHKQRSFDVRLTKLTGILEGGVSLDRALRSVPGLVSDEVALAVTVGQFKGKLTETLQDLPERQGAPQWLELGPRLLYPGLLLIFLLIIVSFLMVFIGPKYEKIFAEFKLRLPYETELVIALSRASVKYGWLMPFTVFDLVVLIDAIIFSAHLRWYFPGVSYLYRLHARSRFLRTLGLMLQTNRPLPAILDHVLDARLLPSPIHTRAERLAEDLRMGVPLAESLTRHGLVPASMKALVASAEKANHLPWALHEMGNTLESRCARVSYRFVMIVFPLAVFACAGLVGFVAVAMFSPLAEILNKMAV